MEKTRVAVVGVGHLGKEHARVYAGLPDVELVAVADPHAARGQEIAKRYGVKWAPDYKDLLNEVDAVSVAAPTIYHFDITMDFLENGVAVLVEKPMTTSVDLAEKMVAAADRKAVPLQVGHIERFNPAFAAIRSKNISPIFIECHRLSPYSFRSGDIGVVLDLMIHDLDIILLLVGMMPERVDAAGVNIITPDREDICNARLSFPNGAVANVTASRVSIKKMRKMRIFSEDAYISLDYQAREAMIYKKSPLLSLASVDPDKAGVESLADLAGMSFGDLLQIDKVQFDDYEPLQKELESFIACVRNGTKPEVPGEQAMQAIRVAEDILADVKRHLDKIRKRKA